MPSNSIRIPFPYKGKDENWAMSGQPPLTSPDLKNVRPRDVQDKRSRGGQRPPVRKIMYWWDYPGGGADLGLPDPSPIIGMDQVTAVYYASIAGDDDSGAGDPEQDALVFLANNWDNNNIQIYTYTGNSLGTGDAGAPAGISRPVGLALDQEGKIWANPDGDIWKFDLDGTELIDGPNADPGALVVSNKSDGLIFHGSGDDLYARLASDGTTVVWSNDLGNGSIQAIQQLESSDDLYVGISPGDAQPVKKVSRVDGSIILNMGKVGIGARTLAVDETNGWIYHAYNNIIARVDLSDNGNPIELAIGAGDLNKIVLYGGKVYICGARIGGQTVWRLDAALAGIEVDYDTGAEAHDMEFKGTSLYVVGVKGTTEDAEDGNVNILDSDLVKIESPWNIGPDKELLAIAEKI